MSLSHSPDIKALLHAPFNPFTISSEAWVCRPIRRVLSIYSSEPWFSQGTQSMLSARRFGLSPTQGRQSSDPPGHPQQAQQAQAQHSAQQQAALRALYLQRTGQPYPAANMPISQAGSPLRRYDYTPGAVRCYNHSPDTCVAAHSPVNDVLSCVCTAVHSAGPLAHLLAVLEQYENALWRPLESFCQG